MSEVYRFFDSVDGDRAYNAESFAAHFKYVLTSGIFNGGTNLKVTCDGTSMQSHIKMGCAWIEGHSYENTDDNLVLTHDAADGTLDRIDRVVLRLDRNTDKRYIKAAVLKGTAAVTPAAPALTRDSVIYEISLAQILVVHNTSVIAADKVTDERLNESVCGLVNSLIKLETAEMQAEFDAFMASLQGQGYIPASQKGVAGGVALYDTVSAHMADYTLQIPFGGTSTNSGNAYSITTPAISALSAGMAICFKCNADSTGAVTFNWNGKGAKNVLKSNQAAVTNLKTNGIYTMRYDGTNFILQGEGASGNATASDLLSGKTATTDAGEIVGTLIQNPEVTFAASDIIRTEYMNPSGAVYNTTYTKRNEFKVNGKGTVRVKMGLYRDATSGYVYGKVYINGVAVGTERSTSSTTAVYFTEDFTVNENDLISIWTKGSNTNLMQYVYTAIEYDFTNVPDAPTRTL